MIMPDSDRGVVGNGAWVVLLPPMLKWKLKG